MKEKIYTIPVTEAFGQECECPLCLLHRKLENDYTDYYLGPALMEPDSRIDTNKKGFCRRHFELLYNRQENRLGLALETDTHLKEKLSQIKEISKDIIKKASSKKNSDSIFSSLTGRFGKEKESASSPRTKLLKLLTGMENSCTICGRVEHTMNRYLDVTMYLWSKETDFRKLFSEKKGFCLVHLKMLIEASHKYLKAAESEEFLGLLMEQQIENMDRIEQELDWFTKKFDYRNTDAPWGNSKDALPRSIQKLKGYSDLK